MGAGADVLDPLSPIHKYALQWFIDNADTVGPWPSPIGAGIYLATRAKGIYKPRWSRYALSVRRRRASTQTAFP
jgi:hypothetical protein